MPPITDEQANELLRELQRTGIDYSSTGGRSRPVDIIAALEANPNLTLADVLPPDTPLQSETLGGEPQPRPERPPTSMFPLPPLPSEPRTDLIPTGQGLEPQPRQGEQGLRLHMRGEHQELAQDARSAGSAALTAATTAIGGPATTVAGAIGRGLLNYPRATIAGIGLGGAAMPVTAQRREAQTAADRIAELERDIRRREGILESFATRNFQSKTARDNASLPHQQALEAARTELETLRTGARNEVRASRQAQEAERWRNTGWTQAYPWLIPAFGSAGAAVGIGLSNSLARRAVSNFNTSLESLSQRWGEAVQKAENARNAASRQAHLTRAEELGRQFEALERRGPSPRQLKYATAAPAAGAEAGVTVPLIMDEWHALGTPAGSPAREHVAGQFSDWRDIAARYGMPLVGGLAAGKVIGTAAQRNRAEPPNYRAETMALGGSLPEAPPSFWQRVFGRGGSSAPPALSGTSGSGATSASGTGQQLSLPSPQRTIGPRSSSDRPPEGATWEASTNRWVINTPDGRRFLAGPDRWPEHIPQRRSWRDYPDQ